MGDNVTEEFKPNPCYWCRKETELKRSVIDGFWVKCRDEEYCWATGPKRETEDGAILAWNSLAARLKMAKMNNDTRSFEDVYRIQTAAIERLESENARLREALDDHRNTIRVAICELKEHIQFSKLVEELCDFVTKSQRDALEKK